MAREAEILEALLAGRSPRRGDWILHGDDACVLPIEPWRGARLVATTDGLEEGVHFREGWLSIEDLAWKVLAVNLSDLAAVGAMPVGYLLAVSWPERLGREAAERLSASLREAERTFSLALLGGDTDVTEGPLRLSATVLGRAEAPAPILRSGARPGDAVFVSGPLGGPAAAVARLAAGEAIDDESAAWRDAARRFRRPQPRLMLGRRLAGHAHAAIDLSDGLLPDLCHVARASGLAARIDLDRLPVHAAAKESPRAHALATEGGEDYELLVVGPSELTLSFPELFRVGEMRHGVAGEVTFSDATLPVADDVLPFVRRPASSDGVRKR